MTTLVCGVLAVLGTDLQRSSASRTIDTDLVKRDNGTDRHQNARRRRKTYSFSKQPHVHDAVTYFVAYRCNVCWPVRTLRRRKDRSGPCTPAMSAGLADHPWTIAEWATYPIQCLKPTWDTTGTLEGSRTTLRDMPAAEPDGANLLVRSW
ncbi:MAG: hypothetical protein HYV63_08910 [Candidatus Schekmanbacteria bacterium]|nr:hypothetical protein [Candidatus Schekmanbacteria bacterium]